MTIEWQTIETRPKDGPILLYFGKRQYLDRWGQPISLSEHRDVAERTEIGFCKDGVIYENGTGHRAFEDFVLDDVPTHWAPLNPPSDDPDGGAE